MAGSVRVDHVADPLDARVGGGGQPLHVQRELDLALSVDPVQVGGVQTRNRIRCRIRRQRVRLVGVVVPPIAQGLIHQRIKALRTKVERMGKAPPLVAQRAQADPPALCRDQRVDLPVEDLDGELRPRRQEDLGRVGAEGGGPRQQPGRCRIHPVPPTVSSLMRSVGWPTDTGTDWPSLPQVPGASSRSCPIMSTLCKVLGPLPTSVAPRTIDPTRPPSIRYPSVTANTKSPVTGSTCPPPSLRA